jgi:hypothetical protein
MICFWGLALNAIRRFTSNQIRTHVACRNCESGVYFVDGDRVVRGLSVCSSFLGSLFLRSSLPRFALLLVVAAGAIGASSCAKKEPPIAVPDVSQQDLDQAQKTLAASKLKAGAISGGSGTGAYVVSQSPTAGQQVSANSAVDLVLALPVTVPLLTGSDLTDAVSSLQGLGLKVGFVRKASMNPFAKAKVEQQDPAANSVVHANSVVTLTVSTPPDVGGLLGVVAKEPAYQNLKPQYKKVLDAFLGNPSTPRSMDGPDSPSAPSQ